MKEIDIKLEMIRILLTVLAIAISVTGYPAIVKDSLKVEKFGLVHLYVPDTKIKTVTIMISGDGGWKYGVLGFSEHFAAKGSLVIGVDILAYYKELRSRTDDCYHIENDFIMLSTDVEEKLKLDKYQEPLLMGYSSGATLVYAILAQARPKTFIGGISLGFCPDVELPKYFCEFNGLKIQPVQQGKSYNLDPDSKLGNRWIVLQGKLDDICNFENTQKFVLQSADAELIPLEKVGHGFSKWADFMPQWDQAFDILVQEFNREEIATEKIDSASDSGILPIEVTDAKLPNPVKPMLFFISGDGGWYSFEQSMANLLAEEGIPTVGLDAKKYFWQERTPEESAGDISRVLVYYLNKWQKNRIVLMGYSLGAELIPFMIEKFPADIQEKIRTVVLLSPEENTDFEIHVTNMLGLGSHHNTYDVVAELKKISPKVPIHIIVGSDEKSNMPAKLSGSPIQFDTVPGGHHYNNETQVLLDIFHEKKIVN